MSRKPNFDVNVDGRTDVRTDGQTDGWKFGLLYAIKINFIKFKEVQIAIVTNNAVKGLVKSIL